MGCGTSKDQQQKLQFYKSKLEELMAINGQLAASIADLKDVKMKRKPIYVLHDQEMEDLVQYKAELESKFKIIEIEIVRITKQLQMQVKPDTKKKHRSNKPIDLDQIQDEEQWRKNMMEDNDITIKPFENLQLEVDSNKSEIKSQHNSIGFIFDILGDILVIDSQTNIKKQIMEARKGEQTNENLQLQIGSQKLVVQEIPPAIEKESQKIDWSQNEKQQAFDINEIKININGLLGDELNEYNHEIKNKLFSQENNQQPNKKKNYEENEMQLRSNELQIKEISLDNNQNLITITNLNLQKQLKQPQQHRNSNSSSDKHQIQSQIVREEERQQQEKKYQIN